MSAHGDMQTRMSSIYGFFGDIKKNFLGTGKIKPYEAQGKKKGLLPLDVWSSEVYVNFDFLGIRTQAY